MITNNNNNNSKKIVCDKCKTDISTWAINNTKICDDCEWEEYETNRDNES